MKLSRKVKQLIQFGLDNNLEIISYGLAPNPNGFCFESHGDASERVTKHFHKLLESLTPNEVKELRKAVF